MKQLTIFFDQHCALCQNCRAWLQTQPQFIALHFIAYQSQEARQIFPELDRWDPAREIVVLADTGEIYTGADAWIMILYATTEHRELALKLAHPNLRPLAKKTVVLVSKHRRRISRLLRNPDPNHRETIQELEHLAQQETTCSGSCQL